MASGGRHRAGVHAGRQGRSSSPRSARPSRAAIRSSSPCRSGAGWRSSCRSRTPRPPRFRPTAQRIAYNPIPPRFQQWKAYRGGTASEIWLYNPKGHAVEEIPQPKERANDVSPMWIGDTVFFRSDRDGEFNIFAFDTEDEGGAAGDDARGFSGDERVGRRRTDRLRAGGRAAPARSRLREVGAAEDRRRVGPARDAGALRARRPLDPRRGAVADRHARAVRLPRRDRHRAGGEGGRAQPDQQPRRARPRSRVVARRPLDRVVLGCRRRVSALHRRRRTARATPRAIKVPGEGFYRAPGLVAGLAEDRVFRQLARRSTGWT